MMRSHRTMHESVVASDRPYTIIWVCNNLEASQLGYFWFRRQYKMVPHEFHKNMRCLAIVHPGLTTRMTLLLLSYMLKQSFWDKLIYADRIEFLDEVVDPKALQLPKDLYDYDRMLDQEAAMMAEQHFTGSGGFAVGSMSMMGGVNMMAGMPSFYDADGTQLGHDGRSDSASRREHAQPTQRSWDQQRLPGPQHSVQGRCPARFASSLVER